MSLTITFEQAKSFSLFALKAVLSGAWERPSLEDAVRPNFRVGTVTYRARLDKNRTSGGEVKAAVI